MEQPTTPTRVSYMTLEPPAPSPEKSPQSYTSEKIRERLNFIKRVKNCRDINPRSEIFLQLYTDAAENALVTEDMDHRLSYCQQLHRYDKFIQENTFLSMQRSQEQEELERKLLRLKKLEYYLRYGDYLAQGCKTLRDASKELESNELQHFWTEVSRRMKDERLMIEKSGGKTKSVAIPTLMAIWHAANAIGTDKERSEWVIERYAERNELAHSSVTELLQTGRWYELAKALYQDRKDLRLMIPPELEDDIEKMCGLIDSIRTKYFIVEIGDEEYPETWRANEEASKFRAALRSKEEEKDKKKAELVEAAVKKANEMAKKRNQTTELVGAAITGKRKASQPLPSALMAKKQKEMEKVVGIQQQVRKKEEELDMLYKKRDEAVYALGNFDVKDEGEGGEKA